MKILLKNHFENAFEAMRANRGRTLLTITGMAIGVASITATLSIADGFSKLFSQPTTHNDFPLAVIRSGNEKINNPLTETTQLTHVNTLTSQDVHDINKITDTKAAPMAFMNSNLKSKYHQVNDAKIIGSTKELQDIAQLQLRDGQFIGDTGGVVIGEQLSIDLFATENSIGNVITIRGESVIIVGVLKRIKQPIKHLDIDFNSTIIMPLAVSKKFTQGAPQIQQIVLTGKSHDQLKTSLAEADKILEKNHYSNKDWRILIGNEIDEPKTNLLNFISIFLIIVGGISLLVGSVSIMNIMIANVAERQREISIRRAVGATGIHVINQFLIESAIIGLLGGVLGYLIGLIGVYVASFYLPFTPFIYWQTAILVISLSIIIGVTAGIYPAIRAVKRNPIDSLRY